MEVDHRLLPAPHDLLDGPYVVRVTGFDDLACVRFRRQLHRAVDAQQEYIPVVIDTNGGNVYGLFGMMDELDVARRHAKVATIAIGCALSAGADLLAAGDKGLRFVSPTATVMIHDLADDPAGGKIAELRTSLAENSRLHEMSFDRLAKNCGKPRSYFRDLVHSKNHGDIYLTPKQCVKHGIADHVGIPELTVNVTVETKFGLPARK
jgi:ATP-dependent Clp protease protease subunit